MTVHSALHPLLHLIDRVVEGNHLVANAPHAHLTRTVMVGGLPSNHDRFAR